MATSAHRRAGTRCARRSRSAPRTGPGTTPTAASPPRRGQPVGASVAVLHRAPERGQEDRSSAPARSQTGSGSRSRPAGRRRGRASRIVAHCTAITAQNAVSVPASVATICATLSPQEAARFEVDQASPANSTDGMQPQRGEEQREELRQREQAGGDEDARWRSAGRRGSARRADPEARSPRSRSRPGRRRSSRASAGRDGRWRWPGPACPGRTTARCICAMKKPGSVSAGVATSTTLQITSCTCGRPGRHQVALEQPDEERAGEQPDLSHGAWLTPA